MLFRSFLDKIISYLDEKNGSFKGAPKFPQFYLFDTMFYYYLKTNDKKYFTPVEILLKNISSKGIYDQLAGGIARYTVDENWIIPHFEKMLYDNIQFINLLTKFYQKTKNEYFKNKLKQTIQFINQDFKNNLNFKVGRYHSLKLKEPFKSNSIKITMRCSKTKIPMGLEDNQNKIYGFQFHPESFLTTNGKILIKKILSAKRS